MDSIDNAKENLLLDISPREFEQFVQDFLRKMGVSLEDLQVKHLEKLSSDSDEYEIDVTARFQALGAEFLVLIECKKHSRPIERAQIQILNDRIREINAHKGIFFTTASFQSGALSYARKHKIALVQVVDGKATYIVKAHQTSAIDLSWLPKFDGYFLELDDSDGSILRYTIGVSNPSSLKETFEKWLLSSQL